MYVLYIQPSLIGNIWLCDVNADLPADNTRALWLVPGTFDGDGDCLPEYLGLI